MNSKAIILCGGMGKRLRPLSYYIQKAMIPLGKREKPLLEYVIRLLAYYKVQEILLLADYKQDQIINYFGDGSRFDVRLSYLRDDPAMKGSLGALLNAYKHGFLREADDFLVYYGDIISNISIRELLETHREKQAAATIALSKKYPVPVGVAGIKDGKVVEFTEKPDLGKPVSIGILALNGTVLRDWKRGDHETDIMGDLIPRLISKGGAVYPYVTDCYWYDVGSLEKYEKLSSELLESKLGFLFGQGD